MPTLEDLQKDLKDSDAAIRSNMADMKAQLDLQKAALDGMKAAGDRPETPPEVAKRMDALDKSIGDGNTRMAEIQAEILKSLTLGEEARQRLDLLEKATSSGGSSAEVMQTAGHQLIELLKAEDGQKMIERFASKSSAGLPLPGLNMKSFEGQPGFSGLPADVVKALTTTMTTNFIPPMQIPGFIPQQRRRLRMRDLIPIVQTTAPYILYLRQTGFLSAAAGSSVTGITRDGTVATVTQTGHGYSNFDLVKISGAVQAAYNGNKRITVVDANTYTFGGVAGSPTTPATGTILAQQMNAFGAANFVAEGDTKPEAQFEFEERSARVQVIAHWIAATRQVFDDMPGLRASVDNQLIFGLLHREDRAILYGTGVGAQIPGIMLDPDAQAYAWSQGRVNDTKADALRRARTLVELALYDASGAVIHPTVWEDIELEKGTDGHYLWVQGPAGLTPGGENIWRVPLVVTPAMAPDQFLTGAFGAAATLYDREQANIRFSDSDGTDFQKNIVKVLAEERMGLALKNPEAMVIGTFDQAPEPAP